MTTHICRRFGPITPVATAKTSSQQTAGDSAADLRDRQLGERYMARLNELTKEAGDSGSKHILVNCLTLSLATIVVQTGNLSAIGDVLYRLGNQVVNINEWVKAQAAAKMELDKGATSH